jgi:hypothetical protein
MATNLCFQFIVNPDMESLTSVPLDPVAAFIAAHVHYAPGCKILFAEFKERFLEWLPADARCEWSSIRLTRALPERHGCGTGYGNKAFVINAAWEPTPTGLRPLALRPVVDSTGGKRRRIYTPAS